MAHIARASREQDICVFIGRFQPLHAGHLWVILMALQYASHLIVIFGSANEPRRPDLNPFFADERIEMLRQSLPPEARERVTFMPMEDSNYSRTQWNEDVVREVTARAIEVSGKLEPKIALIGHAKDHTSFYLSEFPQWDSIDVTSHNQLNATDFREAFFSTEPGRADAMFKLALDNDTVPKPVINWLHDFQKTDAYGECIAELDFCRRAGAVFKRESYPDSRNTVTGDALILHSSHVLLIRRAQYPFKGCWALPGGHLNIDESVRDCALREGYEETGIKVPKIVFERSMIGQDYFDAPRRDPRGRYITHTFMFNLEPMVPAFDTTKSEAENKRRVREALRPPKVKGMDDADKAKWWHLSKLDRRIMAFDHYPMIRKMTANIKTKD